MVYSGFVQGRCNLRMNITTGISVFSLIISGCAVYYARSTILKNDLRGKLAINLEVYEGKKKYHL